MGILIHINCVYVKFFPIIFYRHNVMYLMGLASSPWYAVITQQRYWRNMPKWRQLFFMSARSCGCGYLIQKIQVAHVGCLLAVARDNILWYSLQGRSLGRKLYMKSRIIFFIINMKSERAHRITFCGYNCGKLVLNVWKKTSSPFFSNILLILYQTHIVNIVILIILYFFQ